MRDWNDMDIVKETKKALDKYGKASVNHDLTNSMEVFNITWKLNCYVRYDRASERYEFRTITEA